MDNTKTTVEALKKVSLLLTAGTTAGGTDLISAPQPMEFIYGIGSRGLTGLEYALAGKQAGDEGALSRSITCRNYSATSCPVKSNPG